MNWVAGRIVAGSALIAAATAPTYGKESAAEIPKWTIEQICTSDSARGQCVVMESRARDDVASSWQVLPNDAKKSCLRTFKPPLEPSWRVLGNCIEFEARNAIRREALARQEAERKQAAAWAAERAKKRAAIERKEQERQRIQQEAASFLALLERQRREEAEAARLAKLEAARKALAAKRAKERARRDAEARRRAEEAAKRAEAIAARRLQSVEALRKAEAEREAEAARKRAAAERAERERISLAERLRLSSEEASFLALLDRQRREDAARARAKADAKATKAAEAKAAAELRKAQERERIAREEATFLALVEEQQRAEARARRLAEKAQAKAEAETKAKARARTQTASANTVPTDSRQLAVRQCETKLRKIATDGKIQFESSRSTILPVALPTLDELARAVVDCGPEIKITVEGHTDSSGRERSNRRLSVSRARAVVSYLRKKGVPRRQLASQGFGSSRPLVSNETPEGRAKNRRIEFVAKGLPAARKKVAGFQQTRAPASQGAAENCQADLRRIARQGTIQFASSRADILLVAMPTLDKLARSARACGPDVRIIIEGHTDASGDEEKNRELSRQRATSVANYLRDRGVPPKLLMPKGFGSEQPIATNATPAGRARNRRIKFVALSPKDIARKAARTKRANACKVRLNEVLKNGKVEFVLSGASLLLSSQKTLEKLVEAVNSCEPKLKITVEGHTDTSGNAQTNLELSTNRAKVVLDYLRERGIAADRLAHAGFGGTRPIATNATKEGRERNRRIEISVR